jgi:hypothetical protein
MKGMAINSLFESSTVAFIALSLALFASGYFTARMQSWFLAAVNWLGAFIVLVICSLDLVTQNGSWPQFGIVIVVVIAEATLLVGYVYRVILGKSQINKP